MGAKGKASDRDLCLEYFSLEIFDSHYVLGDYIVTERAVKDVHSQLIRALEEWDIVPHQPGMSGREQPGPGTCHSSVPDRAHGV